MHWYEESVGHGTPVLFLPGSGWCGNAGMNIADELKADHQVLMVDLPGIGRSDGIEGRVTPTKMGTWVRAYLDNRGIERCHLIGHSLGGAILLTFAAQYPEKVLSLTLLDVGYCRVPRFPVQVLGSVGYLAPIIAGLEQIFGPSILKKVMGDIFGQDQAVTGASPSDSLETKIADVKRRGWYTLDDDEYLRKALAFEPTLSIEGVELWLALYRMNPFKFISQVRCPCLLLYGTFPSSDAKFQWRIQHNIDRCRALNPDIDYRPVPFGHYVHWSDTRVVQDVGVFIRQHAGHSEKPQAHP